MSIIFVNCKNRLNEDYNDIAYCAVDYLRICLENYLGSINHNIYLEKDDFKMFSNVAFEEAKKIRKTIKFYNQTIDVIKNTL